MPAPKVTDQWKTNLTNEYVEKREKLNLEAEEKRKQYKEQKDAQCRNACRDMDDHLQKSISEIRYKMHDKPDGAVFFEWGFLLSFIPAIINCNSWPSFANFVSGYLLGLLLTVVLYFLVWGFMALSKSNNENMIIHMTSNNGNEKVALQRKTEDEINQEFAGISRERDWAIDRLNKEEKQELEDHKKKIDSCFNNNKQAWMNTHSVLDWLAKQAEEVLAEAERTAAPAESNLTPTVTYTVDRLGISAQLSTTEYIARTADGGYEKIEHPIWKETSFVFYNMSVKQPYNGDDLIEKRAYASFLYQNVKSMLEEHHPECKVNIYQYGGETICMLITAPNSGYLPVI